MDRNVRFFLTAEEIAFIGRPMADLLQRGRTLPPVEERMRQQEDVEDFLRFRGPAVNYDPRYGSVDQINSDLGL